MMAENPALSLSLKHLLDGIQKSQKKDIKDFSRGYLNEGKLFKQPKPIDYVTWESARQPPIEIKSRSSLPKRRTKTAKNMADTLQYFTLGNAITTPEPTARRQGTKGPVRIQEDECSKMSSQGSYSKLDDGVLVENMGGVETMSVSTRYPKSKSALADDRYSSTPDGSDDATIRDTNYTMLHHKFMPSHMQGVTKKDQYKKLISFESSVLRKQDALEQNVMSGVRAAEHLEDRLQKVLNSLIFKIPDYKAHAL